MDSQCSARSNKRSWDSTNGFHQFNNDIAWTQWVKREWSNHIKEKNKDYVLFKINWGNILK